MNHERKARGEKQPPRQTPSHKQEGAQAEPTCQTDGNGQKPAGANPRRRLKPRAPADYDSRIDGQPEADEEEMETAPPSGRLSTDESSSQSNGGGDEWHPPVNLPDALLPGGVAERAEDDAEDDAEEDDDEDEAADLDEDDEDLNEEDTDKDEDDPDEEDDLDDEEAVAVPLTPKAQRPAVKPPIPTDADCFAGYLKRLEERRSQVREHGLVGTATGLPQLDEATGGVQGITVIGGGTQTGKTSLAVQICLAALRHDPRLAVVYYLLDDMSLDDLFDQMICLEARVDLQKYEGSNLSSEEQKRVHAAAERLQREIWPRMCTFDTIPDSYGQGLTGERIFTGCCRFMEQVGAARVMPVIDMFDDIPLPRLMGGEDRECREVVDRAEADPGHWRLQQVLKLRSGSEDVCPGGWPVLVLAKLRKSTSGRAEEPTIDDLLGSVELAYKAKRVFFLVPDRSGEADAPIVPVTLIVKKGRHGRSIRLPLRFHHTQFRFDEAGGLPTGGNDKERKGRGGKKPAEGRGGQSAGIDPLAGMEP